MKVVKIVTHDGVVFYCSSQEELDRFMWNYWKAERERLIREYPDMQFLVDRMEFMEMSEEEYFKIYPSVDSMRYFAE